jgi:hypothetical protein
MIASSPASASEPLHAANGDHTGASRPVVYPRQSLLAVMASNKGSILLSDRDSFSKMPG